MLGHCLRTSIWRGCNFFLCAITHVDQSRRAALVHFPSPLFLFCITHSLHNHLPLTFLRGANYKRPGSEDTPQIHRAYLSQYDKLIVAIAQARGMPTPTSKLWSS